MEHPTMHMEEELWQHIVSLDPCILIFPQTVANYNPNLLGLPNLAQLMIAESCYNTHLGETTPHFHQVNLLLQALQQAERMWCSLADMHLILQPPVHVLLRKSPPLQPNVASHPSL